MTETLPPPGDRIEPVDIQQEMQSSYIDYAMSVIVSRALPDVRDGLKPVHRRVLYSMFDTGLRPDRSYVKCSRVVGDVMGNYHPHGDTSIYDTLVRLAQPWSMRYPLVDGQGNFGSPGNDPAAAMRYCVVADTRVKLADGSTPRIGDLVPDAAPNSDNEVDLKVLDRNGDPVRADALFHSGEHPTLTLRTAEGFELTGTRNHPVLALVSVEGVPTLLWKLLEEVEPGDRVAVQRVPIDDVDQPTAREQANALGAAARFTKHPTDADRAPEHVWRGGPVLKRVFLRLLLTAGGTVFTDDGTIRLTYTAASAGLVSDVQRMLLEFGVLSRLSTSEGVPALVVVGHHDVSLLAARVGLRSVAHDELVHALAEAPVEAVDPLAGIDDPELRAAAEPLVDGRFHYAEVTAVADAGVQPVFSLRVDTEDHAFVTDGFISHNTEARLMPLAMEMLRDIGEDTVDFAPNYDGKTEEPLVLPSRIPNLLVNGGSGIAVGMATNLPPHNLREVADGVVWALDNPDADDDQLLAALLTRIKGPDFPTRGLILGTGGIEDAYRTGRGSVRMRSVVEVEEDAKGRTILVVTELPYQVNPDNLIENIAQLVRDGKITGISDVADESNRRIGMRIVIGLKRDAVAKVVLNNLFKHTQLQHNFGVNMLALVDQIPRTLRLDQIIRHYVKHQLEVIVRRTRYRLRKAEERAHILRGYARALDALDEVIALIRRSPSADEARSGLMALLEVDEVQATAILELQLRRLAALERQRIIDELGEIERYIGELNEILASEQRQREIVRDELKEIAEKYGDDRRTKIIPFDGEVSIEDLIAVEDVVVTITRTGYAKRTKTDLYRAQKRGGKGVQGAALKQDDIVAHFFVCSTHDWILFFTNKGRVYRAKAYELPEANRAARGQHVANLLAFQPDEQIAQVIQIKDYTVSPYLVLATRDGLVKKSKLSDFDSNRAGGLIGINLREDDELVGAVLCSADDDLLLVSAGGQSIRFHASDEALRPMGRATSGVQGMRFNAGDELLALGVVKDGTFVLVATDGGYAKRTPMEDYSVQGRGGKGVLTIQHDSRRGRLVGAVIVELEDELYAITSSGGVIRTTAAEVRKAGRQTKGVRLMNLGEGTTLVAIARSAEETAAAVETVEAVADAIESGDPTPATGTPAEVVAAEHASTEETGSTDEPTAE
ncbi:DNA gyrase subunit A [Actinokineospora spheciospongiae]|uniref:DNA gyrase subunit A n=1 Tax=Actinokineospora spheciospongiae TaxID=909613 RepID=W7INL7_9PSEU|nr:DNA gyrase subunit A [Actinokineospora spheciospongiae]EWC58357.1 DNA gyrase subunit A [Actinokineospora spheciospongiae]